MSIDQVIAQVLEDDEEDREENVYSDNSDDDANEEEENDDEQNAENIVPVEWRRLTTTDNEFETKRNFNFCANPGVQEEIQNDFSIYDYFRLFLTNSIAESIVHQTNLYARQL